MKKDSHKALDKDSHKALDKDSPNCLSNGRSDTHEEDEEENRVL